MYKQDRVIIQYSIPNLGVYSIDEDMILYKGENKIMNCSKLSDAKSTLSEVIHRDREEKLNSLRETIKDLELQSTNIEHFRLKNNFQ